jgi:hypothetical protein
MLFCKVFTGFILKNTRSFKNLSITQNLIEIDNYFFRIQSPLFHVCSVAMNTAALMFYGDTLNPPMTDSGMFATFANNQWPANVSFTITIFHIVVLNRINAQHVRIMNLQRAGQFFGCIWFLFYLQVVFFSSSYKQIQESFEKAA